MLGDVPHRNAVPAPQIPSQGAFRRVGQEKTRPAKFTSSLCENFGRHVPLKNESQIGTARVIDVRSGLPVDRYHGDHPSHDLLEEYVFGRLAEPETVILEEHLLICTRCQHSLDEVDQFIAAMKIAAAESPRRRLWSFPDRATPAKLGYRIWGIAFAGACLVIAAVSWPSPGPPGAPVPVTLSSFRGSELAGGGRGTIVPARHPLDLTINAPDIAEGEDCRVEVVDRSGVRVWSGQGYAREDKVAVRISAKLGAGMYWVRLYGRSGELTHEYGLRVE